MRSVRTGRVAYADEPPGLEDSGRRLTRSREPRHRLWTDAYLAAFAFSAHLPLATLDRGFKQFGGLTLTSRTSTSDEVPSCSLGFRLAETLRAPGDFGRNRGDRKRCAWPTLISDSGKLNGRRNAEPNLISARTRVRQRAILQQFPRCPAKEASVLPSKLFKNTAGVSVAPQRRTDLIRKQSGWQRSLPTPSIHRL
jgi:hypothetical protein